MSLNDREKLVLGAIIDYYLTFGDTIGSRTLVKKYSLEFSSATIRNVMADLEDLGYIKKTHTSSGRVPTDMGYKFYIDELLKIRKISKSEREKIELAYERKMTEIDGVLERTSKLLSKLTSYAGVVMEPDTRKERVKKIQLIHINNYTIMAVIVLENSTVRTKKIYLDTPITEDQVTKVHKELCEEIELHSRNITSLELEAILKNKVHVEVEEELEEDRFRDTNSGFFIRGESNILREIRDNNEIVGMMDFFDKKRNLRAVFEEIARHGNYEDGKVNIVLGEDLNIKALEDFSFVFSVYNLGDSSGIIGVIGPKRMEYSKTVGLVEYVTKEVNKVIDNLNDKEGGIT
jgi:heat-inducible transcriptional repressor